MQKKLTLFFLCFSLLMTAIYYLPRNYQQDIVIATYEGCSLNIQSLEDFKNKYPDASLKIYSQTSKEEYSEWLAQQFLSGQEPDIFIIPPEDLEKYIQLNALLDLGQFSSELSSPTYSLSAKDTQKNIILGVSTHTKYPKLTVEALQSLVH